MVGKLPWALTRLDKLGALSLDENHFDGPVPDLSALSRLTRLNLASNQLEGELPESIGELSSLQYL